MPHLPKLQKHILNKIHFTRKRIETLKENSADLEDYKGLVRAVEYYNKQLKDLERNNRLMYPVYIYLLEVEREFNEVKEKAQEFIKQLEDELGDFFK